MKCPYFLLLHFCLFNAQCGSCSVQVWQSSEDALLQMVVVVLVRLTAGSYMVQGWENLGTGLQLLLVSSEILVPDFYVNYSKPKTMVRCL